MNSIQKERVYFSVVDTYDELTGEPNLREEQLILSEDDYLEFSTYDEDNSVFIHWSEEFEVLHLNRNEYLLVNYTTMDGITHENVYKPFKTETIGNVEKFSEWVGKGEVSTSLKERKEEREHKTSLGIGLSSAIGEDWLLDKAPQRMSEEKYKYLTIQDVIDELNKVPKDNRDLPLEVFDFDLSESYLVKVVSLYNADEEHSEENPLSLSFGDL